MVTEVRQAPSSQHSNGTTIPPYSSPVKKGRQRIYWRNVFLFVYFHATALYAVTRFPPHWYTVLLNVLLYEWIGFSITAGCHRLWTHKSYKARWPLRLFLFFGQGFAVNFSIYKWVWVHRLHHKFTDTDADPHNSKRGFFFSQLGWILQRHHEDVFDKKETIDMSDLEEDWLIMLQDKIYPVFGPFCCFLLPTLVPFYFWGEDLLTAWNFSVLRFVVFLHVTGLVNSVAHIWGTRAYDRSFKKTVDRNRLETNKSDEKKEAAILKWLYGMQGAHNYHHVFPWDYKTSESKSYFFNVTLLFLDLCAKLGLAYDFKETSPEMIQKRKLRTGNSSVDFSQTPERLVWGLEDEDMDKQDKEMVNCLHSTETKKIN